MGVAISRIASDLLQWSTGEFGFLDLPDAVAGSSSAMPQKRNPFLLEHAQSRWTSVLGAFVAACTAMHAAPFTNAIAVGTEGVRHASGAFRDLSEAIVLLRLVVARATPRPERMAARAREGLTSSLAAAEALVDATGMDFRSAHRLIGALIEAEGQRALDADVLRAAAPAWPEPIPSFDPDTIARRSAYGGGSATTLTGTALDGLRSRWREQAARARALARQWEAAAAELDRTVQRLCLDSNRAMYLASALNTPAVGGG
jgi:argininosuccinate lyase